MAEVCPAQQALRTQIILGYEVFGVHACLKFNLLSAFLHLYFIFLSLAKMCVYSHSTNYLDIWGFVCLWESGAKVEDIL